MPQGSHRGDRRERYKKALAIPKNSALGAHQVTGCPPEYPLGGLAPSRLIQLPGNAFGRQVMGKNLSSQHPRGSPGWSSGW